ncbi:TetR/AcrR family transcriptional regulator [Streptomyces sp. BH105]|uniref:TetR/AcrR family transcriptional regulator n=1 Tax=Streptomyces sp. BH105 TaxID=3410408 RepID=UPI003CEF3E51
MSRANVRGPYAKTAARRAEIVKAARDSFAERGYTGASLRDIAERAGITHTGLLHHFRDKEELLTAVLAQRDIEEWEQGNSKVDEPEGLAPYLREMLQQHQGSPELIRLWLELAATASRPDHPAHTYFVDRFEQSRIHMTQGMRELAAKGKLHPGLDPACGATLLQAVLNGLQIQWLLDPELDIVQAFDQFLKLTQAPDHV